MSVQNVESPRSPLLDGDIPAIEKSEIRDGMHITWDAAIQVDDGVVLRADVFRPIAEGKYPAIIAYGAYSKGAAFQEKYKAAWDAMIAAHPDIPRGSSNKYQNWEVVDPEKWVPDGYACVRIDARGSGRSPGFMDPWSLREAMDFHDCVEWAATQPWCNGKVGINGISYLAMNAWWCAQLQPPHLAAICPWEGAADYYRELTHHGGIVCEFIFPWYPRSVVSVQHGVGDRGWRSPITGEPVAGPATLPEEVLAKRRVDMKQWVLDRPLDGPDYRERSAHWDKITVPLLTAANWGGQGLHPRGNIEGFVRSASKQKWLEIHGYAHWAEFYTDYGVALQKRFFAHFLKGEDSGWSRQPPVQLQIRHIDRFVERHENEWPLARTQWTKFYLDPAQRSLARTPAAGAARIDYDALGQGVLFVTAPFEAETEITGPVAAKLFLSSSTRDADVFFGLHLFAPDGNEVVFQGSNDPHAGIGNGWLRASHRKLDIKLSQPYMPYHTHDESQPLQPGEPVELDVEIWPTCIVVPHGYRIGLSIRGKDMEPNEAPIAIDRTDFRIRASVGPFRHNDPTDRPAAVFGGTNSLHFGDRQQAYLLLPIVPAK